MNLNILSWNERGLGTRDRRFVVKSLVKKWEASIVILQETKLDSFDRSIVADLWGSRGYCDSVGKKDHGCQRGSMKNWRKKSTFLSLIPKKGSFSVTIRCSFVGEETQWVVTGVYGPNDSVLRDCLWDELEDVAGLDLPWCI